QKFIESAAGSRRRYYPGPAKIRVDVRKRLRQNAQLLLVGIAQMKDIEPDPGVQRKSVDQQRSIRIRKPVAAPGKQTSVDLHRRMMRVREPHHVVKHMILELPEGPRKSAAEALWKRTLLAHQRLEIALGGGLVHLLEAQLANISQSNFH